MANNFVQVPPNSTGLKVDTTELTVGANTVERQNVCIADPATAANIAAVTAGGAVKVDGSAVTQPVSAASLPLPTGASTAAKQPALGTAGAASADVITVQGIAAMTALKVDGSGVTQPVSGTVTANAGTGSFTVAQATASNLKVDLSGTGANATAIKVDNSAVTQPVSGTVTANAGTGTFTVSEVPATSGGCSMFSGSVGATATAIKASAGQLYGWYIYNSNASEVYVQIFNVAAAGVTLGTTAPTISLGIPASSGANVFLSAGLAFGTAISFACTTTRAGSTGPGSTVDVNFWYA